MFTRTMKRFAELTDNKFFEWVSSAMLLGLAIEMLIWPQILQASAFRYVAMAGHAQAVGTLMLMAAVASFIALVVNGRSDMVGPKVRAWTALFRGIVWMQMDIALLLIIGENKGTPSPGIPIYFFLTVGEFYAAWRAATDVRTRTDP
jgi:hypothetical protein